MDINKTRVSKRCDTCLYWYFLDKGFKFQLDICNIAILNIHVTDYHCIISKISKGKVIKVIKTVKNTNLTEKSGTL